jgi:hypothetical protein
MWSNHMQEFNLGRENQEKRSTVEAVPIREKLGASVMRNYSQLTFQAMSENGQKLPVVSHDLNGCFRPSSMITFA